MGVYIDESTAKKAVEDIVKEHTLDYSIYVVKRKVKSPILKTVILGIKLKQDDNNESLFNEFMTHEIQNNQGMNILESEVYLENRALKELFLLSTDVKISF